MRALALFWAAALPGVLVMNYVMNQYFVHGSGVLDVGWFTYLMTNDAAWPIKNLSILPQSSFFSIHFSPFFYPAAVFYNFIRDWVSPHLYFAFFMGFMYGMLSLAIFIAGDKLIEKNTVYKYFFLLFVSLLSAFNGVGLGLIGFPHVEIAIPALLLLFLSLYFTGRKMISYAVLTCFLIIREDAGLHAFFLLFGMVLLLYFIPKASVRLRKKLLFLSMITLLYSVFVILIQKIYFGGDDAFIRIYAGTPPFAHLNLSYLIHKLGFFLENRAYIYVPALLCVILAVLRRNILYVAPVISSLPWLLISLIAVAAMPSTLSNYYAFPLIVILVWPVFANLIAIRVNLHHRIEFRSVFTDTLLVTGLSVALFPGSAGHVDASPWNDVGFEFTSRYTPTQQLVRCIADWEDAGKILYDEPMAALSVNTLQKSEYGYLNRYSEQQIREAETVVFTTSLTALNGPSVKSMLHIIATKDLSHLYVVPGTEIVVATLQDNVPCEAPSLRPYEGRLQDLVTSSPAR